MFTKTDQLLWSTYNLLKESVNYKVPHSPKTLMSDFYVLTYIDTIPFETLIKQGNINALRHEDDLKHDVQYAQSVLYPFLKEHFLNALFFAMCAEARHMFDSAIETSFMKRYGPFIRAFHMYYRHYSHRVGADDPRKVKTDEFAVDNSGYQDSYAAIIKAMKKMQWDATQTVVFFRDAFVGTLWASQYGGEAWASIAEGWLALYNTPSTNYSKLAVNIDHVYDLQHNTGTVFNKLKKYYIGGYGWLKEMLDFKANLINIHDLLPTCSSLMVKLARPVLKAADVKPGVKDNIKPKIDSKKIIDTIYTSLELASTETISEIITKGKNEILFQSIVKFTIDYPNIKYYSSYVTICIERAIKKLQSNLDALTKLLDFPLDFIKDSPEHLKNYHTKDFRQLIKWVYTQSHSNFCDTIAQTLILNADKLLSIPAFVTAIGSHTNLLGVTKPLYKKALITPNTDETQDKAPVIDLVTAQKTMLDLIETATIRRVKECATNLRWNLYCLPYLKLSIKLIADPLKRDFKPLLTWCLYMASSIASNDSSINFARDCFIHHYDLDNTGSSRTTYQKILDKLYQYSPDMVWDSIIKGIKSQEDVIKQAIKNVTNEKL